MTQFALVRRPSPRLADGLVTHIGRTAVDVELAKQQWAGYVAALEASGWATTEVTPAPGLPDSAFIEDTMVVFRDVAVIARPGADERKPEVAAAAWSSSTCPRRAIGSPKLTRNPQRRNTCQATEDARLSVMGLDTQCSPFVPKI